MSDVAREYVKKLDLPWTLKSVAFLLADYHSSSRGCAWPGLSAIAEVMGKDDPRNVRRIIRELEQTGKFRYVPGVGRGNVGSFYFLELEKGVTDDRFSHTKGVVKGVTKGVKSDTLIRNEPGTIEQNPPYPPFQGGKFVLTDRQRTKLAKEVQSIRRDIDSRAGARIGSDDHVTFADVLREACANLLLPFDEVQEELAADALWAARLGVEKKDPQRAAG